MIICCGHLSCFAIQNCVTNRTRQWRISWSRWEKTMLIVAATCNWKCQWRISSWNMYRHWINGQNYWVTATAPEYDLLRAIRQRRLRYLGHILHLPESRVVRHTLVAVAEGGTVYPKGSLFMDCQAMDQLVALAQWSVNELAKQLHCEGLPVPLYHWTPFRISKVPLVMR